MHDYLFAGYQLSSQIALPGVPLARVDLGGAGLRILADARSGIEEPSRWLHHWRHTDNSITLSLARRGESYLLRVPGLCDFHFDAAARRLSVRALDESVGHAVEHLLLDQVLPRVFAHFGETMLHAAMVEMGGRAVLLVGESGAGKSTLAAHLQASGHRLHGDDCVLVGTREGRATARATYPSLRLNPDVLPGLSLAAEDCEPMAEYSAKQRVRFAPGPGADAVEALPIGAIYFLDPPGNAANDVRIEAIAPMPACLALMKQCFAMDMTDATHLAGLLRAFGGLAATVPCSRLSYPRRFDALPATIARLSAHAAGSESRPGFGRC